MRFSIIVMTYKKFDNLEKNLNSIANQIFQDYEIILSDDGSDNFDKKVILQIASRLGICEKLIIKSHKKNMGSVRNYNLAITASKGDIIVPLSQDDEFVDANALLDLNSFFEDPSLKICFGKRITKRGEVSPNELQFHVLDEEPGKALLNLAYRNFIYGATLYFRRELWADLNGFDERCRLLEDYPFAIKLLSNNIKIYPFNRIMIRYDENGVSNGGHNLSAAYIALMNDHVTMYRNIIKNLTQRISSLSVRRAIQYHWKISFYHGSNMFLRNCRKMALYVFYFDIVCWHMLYVKKYRSMCEDYFANRLVEKASINDVSLITEKKEKS